jgi:hypothetical protein
MASIPEGVRQQVAERARHRCEYCQAPEVVGISMEVEHIIPRAKGGDDALDNLCYACNDCNSFKAAAVTGMDAETGEAVRLFNPRIDEWSAHFKWGDDLKVLIGLTAVGRATIDRLKINRPKRQSARLLWATLKLHPPTD